MSEHCNHAGAVMQDARIGMNLEISVTINNKGSIPISNELLARIVRNAFLSGATWAETYKTWFIPAKTDTEERIKQAVANAKATIRRHKVTFRKVDE